jgi:hypothetical protein
MAWRQDILEKQKRRLFTPSCRNIWVASSLYKDRNHSKEVLKQKKLNFQKNAYRDDNATVCIAELVIC